MNKTQKIKELLAKTPRKIGFKGLNIALLILGILLILFVATLIINKEKIILLPEIIISTIKTITTVIATFFIASLIARIIAGSIPKLLKDAEIEQKLILSKSSTGLIYALAILFLLWRYGAGLQNITLLAGLITTAFAFAIRDVIASYLTWYILLTKKPFRIGDHIKIGDDEGKVIHIGTFYVLLDNTPETKEDFLRIPNKIFLDKTLRNFGSESPIQTTKVYIKKLPLNYKEEIEKISKSITEKTKEDYVKFLLDFKDEHMFIKFEYRCNYDLKYQLNEFIIGTITTNKVFFE